MARALDWNQKNIDRFYAQKGLGIEPWGDNLLLLTAMGKKSGEKIITPVVYRWRGDDLVVVASKGGHPEHPRWYHNLEAHPMVHVEVAGKDGIEKMERKARVLPSGPERDELYAFMTEVWPAFADYQVKADRTIPVVVLEPV